MSTSRTPTFRWNEDSGVNGRLCEFKRKKSLAILSPFSERLKCGRGASLLSRCFVCGSWGRL